MPYRFLKYYLNLKRITYLLLFSLFFVNSLNPQTKDYRLLFSANLLQNQKLEDAVATTKILAKNLEKKIKLDEKILVTVCSTLKELADSMKKPFDFVLATSVETQILKKKYNLEPVIVNETGGTIGFIFYLVVNTSQPINDLKSLKNRDINILSKSEFHTASIWLDKLLRDDKLPVKEKFFSSVTFDYKATNVVLPVFFNKCSAAIISKTAFDLLCELNPQLKKTLKIIKQSEPIIFGLISFDGRNDDKSRKDFIYNILLDLHKENYGKQLLDLFLVDKLVPFKDEYWQDFQKLYK